MFKDYSKLQSCSTYIPLFPKLLLSVDEFLFLHPCLLQRFLICALLMLHLGGEGGGKEERRKRERGREGDGEGTQEGGRERGGRRGGRKKREREEGR